MQPFTIESATYLHVIHRGINKSESEQSLFYFYSMGFKQLDLFGMAVSTVETSETIEQPIVKESATNYTSEGVSSSEAATQGEVIIAKKRGRKSNKEVHAAVDEIGIPNDSELKLKLYHPIRQVAKWFGVPASQIRFWENQFEVLAPRKNRKGDRLFRFEDIQYLKTIYYLIRIRKYSIEGAREYLKENRIAADSNYQIIESLQNIKSFLLELKESLSNA